MCCVCKGTKQSHTHTPLSHVNDANDTASIVNKPSAAPKRTAERVRRFDAWHAVHMKRSLSHSDGRSLKQMEQIDADLCHNIPAVSVVRDCARVQ